MQLEPIFQSGQNMKKALILNFNQTAFQLQNVFSNATQIFQYFFVGLWPFFWVNEKKPKKRWQLDEVGHFLIYFPVCKTYSVLTQAHY